MSEKQEIIEKLYDLLDLARDKYIDQMLRDVLAYVEKQKED